ncbi:MAG TPA: iron-sulfur cluster assembly scaffold protein [Desulfonatronum sp.]|nr:iron-sulfur cluster assembly scaffold protein [Desulfonatronum sp.]
MHKDMEDFVDGLQAEIDEAVRREMGEAVYQRWRNPLYMGVLPDFDATASVRGNCGDQMQIYLKFLKNRVIKASFQTDGCGPSVVAASYAAELALGKSAEELFSLDPEHILAATGGLPEDHEHCAFLAIETLHAAARNWLEARRTPNKATAQQGSVA